ncbi:MAG: YggT family protein [Ahrensia sp.]|nr:YggT family protein [Ahrensia sp.]
MAAVFWLIDTILSLYWWIVIISVILSWLYAFNVVNAGNQFVRMIGDFVYQATEPVLSPIRRFMPNLGTIDISPIVLLLGITFLQIFLRTSVAPALGVLRY